MALVSVIRRWHLREQVSIRAIARRTGLSRNTVRKYLANGVVEPRYPKRNSRSNLDHFAEKLAGWLKAESSRGRKQRLSVKELYVRLRQLGYCGSYDRVCAFARRWRRAQQEAARTVGRGVFVPLVFAPGDAFQFDWSEDWAMIDGERVKCASRPRQAVLQPRLRDARLPAANPGDAIRRSQPRLRTVGRRATARHLRQHAYGI